jgi:hypothetical protein
VELQTVVLGDRCAECNNIAVCCHLSLASRLARQHPTTEPDNADRCEQSVDALLTYDKKAQSSHTPVGSINMPQCCSTNQPRRRQSRNSQDGTMHKRHTHAPYTSGFHWVTCALKTVKTWGKYACTDRLIEKERGEGDTHPSRQRAQPRRSDTQPPHHQTVKGPTPRIRHAGTKKEAGAQTSLHSHSICCDHHHRCAPGVHMSKQRGAPANARHGVTGADAAASTPCVSQHTPHTSLSTFTHTHPR